MRRNGTFIGPVLSILLGGLCMLCLQAVLACTSTSQITGKSDLIYGAWWNKDLMGTLGQAAKFIYQPDGKAIVWIAGAPLDQPNNFEGRITIERKWNDSQGNTWYRIVEKGCLVPYSDAKAQTRYALIRVSSGGAVLEGEWSTVNSPPTFGALGNVHYVYHRME